MSVFWSLSFCRPFMFVPFKYAHFKFICRTGKGRDWHSDISTYGAVAVGLQFPVHYISAVH